MIRYASLAPPSSGFGKVLKAWGRTYKKQTEGRSELRFYTGGSQGDERDFIRKIRAGQIDAAGITTTGLGMIVRPILVLTAPGLITELEQLIRVRTQLRDRFDKMFHDAGFELLHWGDGGKNRLFSTSEFARPEDLKSRRPWAWKDDPVFAEFVHVIGANPVRVGAPEVYGGLQTRMLDTVPVSALAAVAMQWYTRLNYMAEQNLGIIIGGSVIKKEKFYALSEHDQKVLLETSERAARAGDPFAQNRLALMYAEGRGVPRSDERAAHWLREAAEQMAAKLAQEVVGVRERN